MPSHEPEDLKRLGERIAEAERRRLPEAESAPPTLLSIGFRFTTEMVAAMIVGVGLGMGVDWAFDHWSPWHTRPWGLVVMVVLGIVAGIKNVMAAAEEMNARTAEKNVENRP